MSKAPQRPRPTTTPDWEEMEREKRITMEFRVEVMWTVMSVAFVVLAVVILVWFGVELGAGL